MTLLKLDFDGPIPRGFLYRLRHCTKLWHWTVEGIRYDKTRRGWHVSVAVTERVAPALVVAAQACLGSDLKRESFNLMRVLARPRGYFRNRWNVLYMSHSRGVELAALDAK